MNNSRVSLPVIGILLVSVVVTSLALGGTGANSVPRAAGHSVDGKARSAAFLGPVTDPLAVGPVPDPVGIARKAAIVPPALPPLKPGEIRYPGLGSDMVPVPLDYPESPAVSADQAIGVVTPGSVTKLMIYSNSLGADPKTAEPGVPQMILPTLAWVVFFEGGTPLIAGSVHQGKQPPAACENMFAVDAITARQLDAVQYCHPL